MATTPPSAVIFDVNETLFSMEPLRERFRAVGLTGEQDLELWFANVLQSGFAASLADTFVSFPDIAKYHLQTMLGKVGAAEKSMAEVDAVKFVLGGFLEVKPYADMAAAFQTLHKGGVRVTLMTNGTAAIGRRLVKRAGVEDIVELVMDGEEAGAWKPAKAAYMHCCDRLKLQPSQVALVAVHPWDCHGAQQAGLQAAHITRGAPWPTAYYKPPQYSADSLLQVAEMIVKSKE